VRIAARWLPLVAVALLAAGFAYLNGAERVSVHLGFTVLYRVPLTIVLYRVPLTIVVFVAFILGMLVMFGVSLRQDLRIRRALRESGMIGSNPEPQNRSSRFEPEERYAYPREEEHTAPRPP